MTGVTFDTHQLIKELETKGFSRDQAEGINSALKNVITVSEVATQRDIKELEINLRHEMKEMELRLTMKIGTLIVAALGFLTAIQKIY